MCVCVGGGGGGIVLGGNDIGDNYRSNCILNFYFNRFRNSTVVVILCFFLFNRFLVHCKHETPWWKWYCLHLYIHDRLVAYIDAVWS